MVSTQFSTEHKVHAASERDAPSKTLETDRAEGRTVAFTNGCFDLLHSGHLALLEAARAEGDLLVVGLNTDASVRRTKGPDRPVLAEAERARVLASLVCVDHVILFDEDSVAPLIAALDPDVLVKGGDYTEDGIVGADIVAERNKRVVRGPHVEGLSTSALLERMRRAGG